MTKFVLHGGNHKDYPEECSEFFREVLRDLGDKPKLLLCLFAQPKEEWDGRYQDWKRIIWDAVSPEIDVELARPHRLQEQVAACDAFYVNGGNNYKTLEAFTPFDLKELFANLRVYAGSSAGGNVISDSFWSRSYAKAVKGHALLPIKFMAHYNSAIENEDQDEYWKNATEKLKSTENSHLPIYQLKDGEYLVLNPDNLA